MRIYCTDLESEPVDMTNAPFLPRALVFVVAGSTAACGSSFGETSRGAEFTSRYNSVVAARTATDPAILGPATVAAERCASDDAAKENTSARLSTANGTVTVADALKECAQLQAEYSKRLEGGKDCEVREFVVYSEITGEGAWTEPQFDIAPQEFVPVPCSEVAQGAAATGFDQVQAAIRGECGGDIDVFIGPEWTTFKKNALDVIIRRERVAACHRPRSSR